MSEQTESNQCQHRSLTFRSGAFYLQCDDCGAWWVARLSDSDFNNDYSRAWSNLTGEKRVKS